MYQNLKRILMHPSDVVISEDPEVQQRAASLVFPRLVAENKKLKSASLASRYRKRKVVEAKKLKHALHVKAQIKVASFFKSDLQIVIYFSNAMLIPFVCILL